MHIVDDHASKYTHASAGIRHLGIRHLGIRHLGIRLSRLGAKFRHYIYYVANPVTAHSIAITIYTIEYIVGIAVMRKIPSKQEIYNMTKTIKTIQYCAFCGSTKLRLKDSGYGYDVRVCRACGKEEDANE